MSTMKFSNCDNIFHYYLNLVMGDGNIWLNNGVRYISSDLDDGRYHLIMKSLQDLDVGDFI